jgi:hypothetical protein
MVGSVAVTAWNPVRRLREAPALRFGYAMAMAGRTLAGYRLLRLRFRRPLGTAAPVLQRCRL